jgi:hypothetical protein
MRSGRINYVLSLALPRHDLCRAIPKIVPNCQWQLDPERFQHMSSTLPRRLAFARTCLPSDRDLLTQRRTLATGKGQRARQPDQLPHSSALRRASDLFQPDPMSNSTLQAANNGDSITNTVNSMVATINQARQDASKEARVLHDRQQRDRHDQLEAVDLSDGTIGTTGVTVDSTSLKHRRRVNWSPGRPMPPQCCRAATYTAQNALPRRPSRKR